MEYYKYISIVFVYILILFFQFVTVGCEREETYYKVTIPVESNIPHYNREHIQIKSNNSFDNLEAKPKLIDLLYKYIHDAEGVKSQKIDALFDDPLHGLYAEVINQNRFIFLNARTNHLFEYHLNESEIYSVAEFGRGPEDIQFAQEIMLLDNNLYVIREDMYISKFNCDVSPCEFEGAISLDFSPYSITSKMDKLAVFGPPEINGRSGEGMSFEEVPLVLNPIRLLDMNGDRIDTFGDFYNTENNIMLVNIFSRSGMVRYSQNHDIYILSYSKFPVIYVYDGSTLNFLKTYKIDDFIMQRQSFYPDQNRISNPTLDHSEISNISIIEDDYLLIEKELYKNYNPERAGQGLIWDLEYRYYAVNLSTNKTVNLGGYEVSDGGAHGKKVIMTKQGFFGYDYELGQLFWIEI